MARIYAQMGLLPPEQAVQVDDRQPFWLWPCNVPIWRLWMSLQTQWQHGFSGPTGLDYTAVWTVLERKRIRRPREAFEALQAMERSALEVWRKQADRDAANRPS